MRWGDWASAGKCRQGERSGSSVRVLRVLEALGGSFVYILRDVNDRANANAKDHAPVNAPVTVHATDNAPATVSTQKSLSHRTATPGRVLSNSSTTNSQVNTSRNARDMDRFRSFLRSNQN